MEYQGRTQWLAELSEEGSRALPSQAFPETAGSPALCCPHGSSGLLGALACTPQTILLVSLGLVWATEKMQCPVPPPPPPQSRTVLPLELEVRLESKRRRRRWTHLSLLQASAAEGLRRLPSLLTQAVVKVQRVWCMS